jgi:hypothetical protein
MGTAPHVQTLAMMQGETTAPQVPLVQAPWPVTTVDGRTPEFTNLMQGAKNPLGAGTLMAGTSDRRAPAMGSESHSRGSSSRNVRQLPGAERDRVRGRIVPSIEPIDLAQASRMAAVSGRDFLAARTCQYSRRSCSSSMT